MVIIKIKDIDVTMPKCCNECLFCSVSGAFPTASCELLDCFVGYIDGDNIKSKRSDDCPIVSVECISENKEASNG